MIRGCHCRVRTASYVGSIEWVDGSVARGVSDPVPSRGGFRLLKLVGLKAARRLFHRALTAFQGTARGLTETFKTSVGSLFHGPDHGTGASQGVVIEGQENGVV